MIFPEHCLFCQEQMVAIKEQYGYRLVCEMDKNHLYFWVAGNDCTAGNFISIIIDSTFFEFYINQQKIMVSSFNDSYWHDEYRSFQSFEEFIDYANCFIKSKLFAE